MLDKNTIKGGKQIRDGPARKHERVVYIFPTIICEDMKIISSYVQNFISEFAIQFVN